MTTTSRDTILDDPQKTIGASELLVVGKCDKTGFLRRQGRLERTFKFLKWRQKFVAISRGCLYVFKDELASLPQKAVSLKLYKQVERWHQTPAPQFAFMLMPVEEPGNKTLVFSCLNEETRKEWMKQIKNSMNDAHRIQPQEANVTDEYVYIEKAIEIPDTAKCQTLPASDDHDHQANHDPEQDYSTIDETVINTSASKNKRPKKPQFKPEDPKPSYQDVQIKGKPKKARVETPPPRPEPKAASKITRLGSDYDYDGTDREEVTGILTQRPEGTYLVRKSRSDNKQVLSVNVGGQLKEFKIFEKEDNRVTLDNVDYFTSLDELITYYKTHNLPKKSTSLFRPYSVTDPRYVN